MRSDTSNSRAETRVTRAQVAQAIRSAESDFARCWSILVNLRQARTGEFLDFQPLLASTCLRLSRFHHSVGAEGRALVARKKHLTQKFFRNRMRSLDRYAHALDAAIQIGREIGDIFAWPWYQNNRDLLVRHLEHPKSGSLPPGIGGAGEVSLIKRYQMLHGSFILYHGITTLLRIGDISLIDLEKQLVESIGELKTSKLSEEELRVTLIAYHPGTGHSKEPPLFLADTAVPDPQRLKRQMARMEQAFNPLHSDAKVSAQGMLYIDALSELSRLFRRRKRGAWVKAAEGLLLFASNT